MEKMMKNKKNKKQPPKPELPPTVNTFLTNKVKRAIGGPPISSPYKSSDGPPEVNNFFTSDPTIGMPVNVQPVLPKQRELEPVKYTVNAKDGSNKVGKSKEPKELVAPTDFTPTKGKKSGNK